MQPYTENPAPLERRGALQSLAYFQALEPYVNHLFFVCLSRILLGCATRARSER